MSMVRLAVDFENTNKEWWEAGGRDLWEGMLEGFDNHSVLLERSIAESWLAQAAMLTGWSGGPDHSPHPIRMVDIDDDEEL